MNGFALLAQAGGGGQVEEIARTFGVDWAHLIAQIISFGIVCVLLYRYAYRPVLTVLDNRSKEIAEAQANAEKIKAELAKTESARQEVLRQADVQAGKLIEEARAAAARVQEHETQKAVAEAQRIITKAQEEAAQTYARSLAELKRHVGDLVIETTGKVTGKVLTDADKQTLAEETAKELAA